MRCEDCQTVVASNESVPLCCEEGTYHFKCAVKHSDGAQVTCPRCQKSIAIPVVYGNAISGADKYKELGTTDRYVYPLTRHIVPSLATIGATQRKTLISACTYVYVSLDGTDHFGVLNDVTQAIALGKPVYVEGAVPNCLSKYVNRPRTYTRQRRIAVEAMHDFLEPGLKGKIGSTNAKSGTNVRRRVQWGQVQSRGILVRRH